MTIKAYCKPRSVEEASKLLQEDGAVAIAGGTDVMIRIRRGATRNATLVNVKGIEGLSGIREVPGGLWIGSGTKLSAVAAAERVRRDYPALAEGALSLGTPQIRNLGTIAGNVCNASPCADTAPGLLISGASVLIAGGEGEREVPIGEFWKGPGINVLQKGEIVTGFFLPEPQAGTRQGFLKLGPRRASDIAVVNLGISFVVADGACRDVRIALGSVAPTPMRAKSAEAMVEGKAPEALDVSAIADAAAADAAPISDVRGSEWYRREAVAALVEKLLTALAKA